MLLAVAAGAWLLAPEWVCASLEAGHWLPEAPFVAQARSPAAVPAAACVENSRAVLGLQQMAPAGALSSVTATASSDAQQSLAACWHQLRPLCPEPGHDCQAQAVPSQRWQRRRCHQGAWGADACVTQCLTADLAQGPR